VHYAHAPANVLEQVLAIRVHLDDSHFDNGPLRILPGTHNRGLLTDDDIHQVATEIPPVTCTVERGGLLMMRPLVVHASSKSVSTQSRRVLHIEFAASRSFDGLELAFA
jgi:ectoine hydroxylase-related dioxygenase (phytanoyl-CoA dioxygenase family)